MMKKPDKFDFSRFDNTARFAKLLQRHTDAFNVVDNHFKEYRTFLDTVRFNLPKITPSRTLHFPSGYYDKLRDQEKFNDCCEAIGIVPHPVLHKLYGPKLLAGEIELTEEIVKRDWKYIRQHLWKRRPRELMEDGRQNRYRQILNAQRIGSFVPVCRAVFPEIESLARAFVLSDPGFRDDLDKEGTAKRIRRVSRQIGKTLDSEVSPVLELPASEFEFYTGEFSALKALLGEYGKNFDPTEDNPAQSPMNRHFNAHGVPYEATYFDGLSAIFLLDVALISFSKLLKYMVSEKT